MFYRLIVSIINIAIRNAALLWHQIRWKILINGQYARIFSVSVKFSRYNSSAEVKDRDTLSLFMPRRPIRGVAMLVHPFLTLRLLMSYIYGAPSKARNANVVYIWTYVWQR